MKRLFIALGFVFIVNFIWAQTQISGIVLDKTKKPVADAIVFVMGTNYETKTDSTGAFVFENVAVGIYKIGVYATGFESYYSPDFRIEANQKKNLGTIILTELVSADALENIDSETSDNLISELSTNEAISSVLHGSRDPYADQVSYNLSGFGFRYRGYESDYSYTSINGASVVSPEDNRTQWSLWGGLNDVTRLKNFSIGLNPIESAFGNIGGSVDIQMVPSLFRKGTRLTYTLANRNYRNRIMFTYSTGLTEKNWAFSFSGSRRWAQQGYVPGTFYDSWAYYVGIEKRFKNQRIILNVFGSPTIRGKQGPSVQEAFDLVGNNLYNPYWGYQNGKIRNSRIANTHQPVIVLSHFWNINSRLTLNTTLLTLFGRNGSTALNWYNAPDPRPDYYIYLPSNVTNPEIANYVAEMFKSPEYSQINWDRLYLINYNSWDTVFNVNGDSSNTVVGRRAQYIVEEARSDRKMINISSYLIYTATDRFKMSIGGHYISSVVSNYKIINDLLGADFWLDIDKYAERDFSSSDSAQSDLNNPNRIVKVGDIFGYNYNSYLTDARLWSQFVFDMRFITLTIADFVSYKSFYRYGKMKNGLYPENSYGKSKVYNFLNYGAKSNLVLKITGRHYLVFNAAYLTIAPDFNNVFLSPRTRDFTVSNPTNEKIASFDVSYVLRTPDFRLNFNVYYTKFNDLSRIMSFYHDAYRAYVNYAMTNIDLLHQGIELGFLADITSSLSVSFAGTVGDYRYNSRPTVTITVDNSTKILAQDKVIYVKNYHVPNVPHTALTTGLRYNAPKSWTFYLNFNYVKDKYLDFNPDRRTAEAVAYVLPGTDLWHKIIDQIKLSPAYTIDFSINKSFRIARKYYLNLNVSLQNLLDNKNIVAMGFEQLRFDQENQNPDKFPPKYIYMYGRQYFINISFNF